MRGPAPLRVDSTPSYAVRSTRKPSLAPVLPRCQARSMCCDVPESELVPPAVAEMLAEYRRLQAGTDWDWGDEYGNAPFFAYGRFVPNSRLMPALREASG